MVHQSHEKALAKMIAIGQFLLLLASQTVVTCIRPRVFIESLEKQISYCMCVLVLHMSVYF